MKYLWYTTVDPSIPAGVFDRPADVPGYSSVRIPDNAVSRLAQRGTQLYRDAGQLVPDKVFSWLGDL